MIRNTFYLYFYALAVTVFFGCIQRSTAQSIQAERLTTDEGLAHNYVEITYTDSRGFLWIGTRNGLQRYDGYTIKSYFSNSVVQGIVEDSKGNIDFVLDNGNIYQLYLSPNGFIQKQLYKAPPRKDNMGISQIIIDGQDKIWMGHVDGLIVFDTQLPELGVLEIPEFKGIESIYSLLYIKGAGVYAGGALALYQVESKDRTYKVSVKSKGICCNQLTRDSQGRIWIASERNDSQDKKDHDIFSIYYLDTSGSLHLFSSEAFNNLKWILTAPDDQFYLFAGSVIEMDINTGRLTETDIRNKDGHKIGFFSFKASCSKQGILWLNTDNGLIKVDLNKKRVRNIYLNQVDNKIIPITIRSVFEAGKDSILAGSYQRGLFLATKVNNTFTVRNFQEDKNWNNIKNFFFKDSKGRIWIGSQGDLMMYDKQLKLLRKMEESHPGRFSFGWNMCEDYLGQLWMLSAFGNLVKIDPEKDAHQKFALNNEAGARITSWRAHPFQHVLLLSTIEGFRYFNLETEQFNSGWALGDKLVKQVRGRVWQAEPNGDGKIYITTQWGGLYAADTATGKIEHFTFEENNFYGFETDKQHRLWIVTDKGIVSFDPYTRKFRMYNRKDGLITNNFTFQSHGKKANGELMFGGDKGISYFDPELLSRPAIPVETHITSFKISGIEEANYLYDSQQITLSYDRNFISFEFSSLDLRNTMDSRYAYKLDGLDEDWNFSNESHFASYPNLRPGTYSFYVKATNSDGNWSEPAFVHITIIPPFWQRGWFIALAVLVGILIIAAIVFNIIRNIRKEYAYQRTSLQSEIKALRSQINPHFIFNALNAIQHFIIKNEKKEANIFLSKFSSLIRKILDYSAQQTISIEEEIGLLTNYLEIEKLRFEENLQWTIETDPSVDYDTHIPTLLIQPIVENAIVHGLSQKIGGGSLSIFFSKENDYILCSVKDSGVGRAYSKQLKHNIHQSKGIDLLKQRIEYINKIYHVEGSIRFIDITDEAGNAAGTEVIIKLPAL